VRRHFPCPRMLSPSRSQISRSTPGRLRDRRTREGDGEPIVTVTAQLYTWSAGQAKSVLLTSSKSPRLAGVARCALSYPSARGLPSEPTRQSWEAVVEAVPKNGQAARREAEVLERLWGWRCCDRCGETIILGEEILRLRRDGGTERLCFGCAGAPRSAGVEAPSGAFPDCRILETRETCDAA
jgi:hypothetical protein